MNLSVSIWLVRPVLCSSAFAALLLGVFGLAAAAHAQTNSDSPRVLTQSYAQSIVVDSHGNVFYAGTNSPTPDTTFLPNGIYEMVAVNGVIPANPTVRELAAAGGTVVAPLQLTVDRLGNVYLTDQVEHSLYGYSIKELVAVNGQVPDSPTVRTLLAGVSLETTFITSDGNGDIFFTTQTSGDTFSYYINEIAAVNGAIPDNPTVITLLTATCSPTAGCGTLAAYQPFADAAGDLFYGSGDAIYELPAVAGLITPGETPVPIFAPPANSGLGTPAVDSNGNLYFSVIVESADATTFTTDIDEVPAVNGVIPQHPTPVVLYSAATTALAPLGIAADGNQNVFVANAMDGRGQTQDILELSLTSSSPPPVAQAALTPASTDFGSVATGSSSAPRVFTLANAGNAALAIASVTLGGPNPSLFAIGSNTCGASLAAGASCTLAVTFTPSSAGSASASLTVTDSVGTQLATLSGEGTAAPTVSIAANPTTVTVSAASTLTWSSTNATTCTASGAWSGAEATSGASAQMPASTGSDTYTLTCSGPGGTASASATVTATAPLLAPTVSIAVSPTSIIEGGTANLTWSSSNATACTASGAWSGTQATSGMNTESPATSGAAVYTLTCTGDGGTANASATLTVSVPTTVVSSSSGRIGGGGAMDWVSLLGLLSLASWLRCARRHAGVIQAASKRYLAGLAAVSAATLLMGPVPSRASDEFGFDFAHGYVGLRAGESVYQPSVNSVLASVGPDAADISSVSINRHQFGGVVYAGVPIWHALSLEIGYGQIGQFPLSMTTVVATGPGVDARAKTAARASVRGITGTASVDTVAQEVVDAAPPAGHGVTLGLALPIDISSRISVEPRFAALVYKSKQTLTTPDATVRDDFWGSGFDVGGTVTARVLRSLYVGAGVDCFHQTRACNAVLLEGVIEYRFGH